MSSNIWENIYSLRICKECGNVIAIQWDIEHKRLHCKACNKNTEHHFTDFDVTLLTITEAQNWKQIDLVLKQPVNKCKGRENVTNATKGEFEKRLRKHVQQLTNHWKGKIHSRYYIDAYKCLEHNLLDEDILGLEEARQEFYTVARDVANMKIPLQAFIKITEKWFGRDERTDTTTTTKETKL